MINLGIELTTWFFLTSTMTTYTIWKNSKIFQRKKPLTSKLHRLISHDQEEQFTQNLEIPRQKHLKKFILPFRTSNSSSVTTWFVPISSLQRLLTKYEDLPDRFRKQKVASFVGLVEIYHFVFLDFRLDHFWVS